MVPSYEGTSTGLEITLGSPPDFARGFKVVLTNDDLLIAGKALQG
jgi:hypothetical protein